MSKKTYNKALKHRSFVSKDQKKKEKLNNVARTVTIGYNFNNVTYVKESASIKNNKGLYVRKRSLYKKTVPSYTRIVRVSPICDLASFEIAEVYGGKIIKEKEQKESFVKHLTPIVTNYE